MGHYRLMDSSMGLDMGGLQWAKEEMSSGGSGHTLPQYLCSLGLPSRLVQELSANSKEE